jgi:DNA transformation protein
MKGIRHDDFVEHVCDLLAPLGEVRARAMFGGYGIYVDDVFCAIIADDTLYFKVDGGNRADYEALGYRPFEPFDDKPMVMSYYQVPAEVMDRRDALAAWGAKALEAGRRTASTRPSSAPTGKARSLAPSRRAAAKRIKR